MNISQNFVAFSEYMTFKSKNISNLEASPSIFSGIVKSQFPYLFSCFFPFINWFLALIQLSLPCPRSEFEISNMKVELPIWPHSTYIHRTKNRLKCWSKNLYSMEKFAFGLLVRHIQQADNFLVKYVIFWWKFQVPFS